jgi:hypothetical protein
VLQGLLAINTLNGRCGEPRKVGLGLKWNVYKPYIDNLRDRANIAAGKLGGLLMANQSEPPVSSAPHPLNIALGLAIILLLYFLSGG